MSELSKRSTVYFDPEIHHALRLKAATAQLSLSEVVNEAVRLVLREDQEDLAALFFYERLPGQGFWVVLPSPGMKFWGLYDGRFGGEVLS